jgi:microcystin-dependent protein
MSVLKNQQDGSSGDPFTVAGTLVASGQAVSSGTLNVTGAFQLDGTAGASGQVMVSAGSGTPTWGSGFPSGGIIIWSGSSASIPSGWLLCDGTNSTPDLRNRFVVGATSTYAVNATGGSADAIVVSHTHTTTVTDPGHTHASSTGQGFLTRNTSAGDALNGGSDWLFSNINSTASKTTGITVSANTTGSSGTNANLPPYFALCYIMKS